MSEGFGFGRAYRLLAAAQYDEVFATRQVLRGDLFVLHFRPNGLPSARLGLVIPKKLARTAVVRNALKRQAREAFRLRRASLPAFDLILRLARPLGEQARETAYWRAEIDALFAQLSKKGGS